MRANQKKDYEYQLSVCLDAIKSELKLFSEIHAYMQDKLAKEIKPGLVSKYIGDLYRLEKIEKKDIKRNGHRHMEYTPTNNAKFHMPDELSDELKILMGISTHRPPKDIGRIIREDRNHSMGGLTNHPHYGIQSGFYSFDAFGL